MLLAQLMQSEQVPLGGPGPMAMEQAARPPLSEEALRLGGLSPEAIARLLGTAPPEQAPLLRRPVAPPPEQAPLGRRR